MLTTLVGLTGGVGAALIAAWATVRARRPRKSRVELVDVSLPPPDPAKAVKDDPPVLDVKVRNIGGQPAVLKRMVVHIHQAVGFGDTEMPMPYDDLNFFVGAGLDVSATYDVPLPRPEEATGARITVDLSQVVGPGEADRFLVRLAQHFLLDTVAYLLHLEVLYDANDRKETSRPLAVVFPQERVVIASAEAIGRGIRGFQQAINEVRQAIDREMVARGRTAPDWLTAPPRSRDELPSALVSVDGNLVDSGENGVYVVNENFWNPEQTIHRYLNSIEERYRKVVAISTSADVVHELLRDALPRIHATLAQLPALHAELSTPEKAVTVQAPAPSGNPDATDDLARLLGGQRELEELRARADAGEQEAESQLHTAIRLANRIRVLGPDHPETLNARETPILWRIKARDMAGAAAALTELIPDQLRVYGPDHPRTLRSRHHLAKCRGEAGNAAGAAAEFAELVPDRVRVLGADHTDTLNSRHELARWRAMAGDAAGAAAAFADLVADRVRVQGPDHQPTLLARYNVAYCRGKAGDAAGAAEAFAELVPDYMRVLGPDHPDTVLSQRALAHWQDQARPENEA